jgi:hypothetical protein
MDAGGSYSGSMSSVKKLGATIAGTYSPTVSGMLAQNGHWVAPFIVQAVGLLAGAVIWFLNDAERPMIADLAADGLLAATT